jgi:hypothetical protein
MPNQPFISRNVTIVERGRSHVAIAANDILENTVIEISPVVMLTAKTAISIINNTQDFENRLIMDEAAVDREYEIFASLGEMELERRLNSGQISPDEYQKILRSKINLNALINAKTHAMPLGYGLLYGISDFPNLVREYDSAHKLCYYRTVQYITAGTDLTYSK